MASGDLHLNSGKLRHVHQHPTGKSHVLQSVCCCNSYAELLCQLERTSFHGTHHESPRYFQQVAIHGQIIHHVWSFRPRAPRSRLWAVPRLKSTPREDHKATPAAWRRTTSAPVRSAHTLFKHNYKYYNTILTQLCQIRIFQSFSHHSRPDFTAHDTKPRDTPPARPLEIPGDPWGSLEPADVEVPF